MHSKNIALIGFPGDYFYKFYLGLQEAGFIVYWVSTTKSMHNNLLNKHKIEPKYLLNPLEGFNTNNIDYKNLDLIRNELLSYESNELPVINDIILMDRILKRSSSDIAICFFYHIIKRMEYFFKKNKITIINSGRDSSIQLASMLLGKKMNIPWIVPTRMRIPKDMYGFTTGYESNSFIHFRNPDVLDKQWAYNFLKEYNQGNLHPQLKIAASSFKDLFKILPLHLNIFLYRLKEYFDDRNNYYTRYTILNLIGMYYRRRKNMALLKFFKPFQFPGTTQFVLYNLHTQPESSIDVMASFFSDQISLIKSIARSIPISHELYVKVHPTDIDGKSLNFYRQIKDIPSVRLIHYACDTSELLEKASIIFTLTGTVSIEAGLRGIPVITLANNFFNSLPSIYFCSDIKKLPKLVISLLNNEPDPEINLKIIEFLAKMKANCFEGEINRLYGNNPSELTSKDIDVLKIAFNQLYDYFYSSKKHIL